MTSSNVQDIPDLYEASIAELQKGLEAGAFTSVDLVKAYFARIAEVNTQGPCLRAVLETNPSALKQAAALDDERKAKGMRSALHGIPLLIKDNIATMHEEGMNTTAGSYALLNSVVPRDATVIAKLRKAGAIFIGKAQLSEWANYRGVGVPSGFSGLGGQATNPYYPKADASGSSTGSGIGTAIGLAAGSLGSETDGSIVSPSSHNNIVGIKPTVGLTSRAGVVPISSHQDSVGPMCRSIADAALVLNYIVGPDPLDEFTLFQPKEIPDYTKALDANALKGVRVGVPRLFQGSDEDIITDFNAALETMKELGAEIVDPANFPNAEELFVNGGEDIVLAADLKARVDLQKYLEGLIEVPSGVRTLADVIAFNKANADKELVEPYWTSQQRMIEAEATPMDDAYFKALAENHRMGREEGIDATLKKFDLDVFVLPAAGRAGRSGPAAIAGYPVVCVPLGFHPESMEVPPAEPVIKHKAPGLPHGLIFIGTAYSEFKLISYAYAYEQKTQTRLKRMAYPEAIPKTQLKDVMVV
ncbi:amidase signature enzyme [Crassisporium funariophilum]|nr:amidase signature enzyme [Crassisporium funariophilum]